MRELQRKRRSSMSSNEIEERRQKDKERYYKNIETQRQKAQEKYHRLNYKETRKPYYSQYSKAYMAQLRSLMTEDEIEQRRSADKERYIRLNGKEYASKKKYKEYWECHRIAVQIRKES